MKPKYCLFTSRLNRKAAKFPTKSPLKAASMILLMAGGSALAATISWDAGAAGRVGDYNVAGNWVGGVLPGTADTAAVNNGGTTLGASTVNFTAGTVTLAALDLAAGNVNDNRPIFNQTGGTLSVGSLFLGHGFGGTKSPEYHLGGGVLNIANAWSFGNGTAIKFLATGGTVNYSGDNWVTGTNGVTHRITLTNNAAINFIPQKEIVLGGGGNAAGSSQLSLSNSSSLTANAVTTILMGNDGTRGNNITLSDDASFIAPNATLALSQWNNGSGTLPPTAAGTVTLAGSSLLNVMTLKTGGNNSLNPQWGVVNLNGGTLETGSIQLGSSTTAADIVHNVVNANGGTIRAKDNMANFFQNVFLNIQAGGLAFDTNGFVVTFNNALTGTGGFTKKGEGVLIANSSILTYTGDTLLEEGELILPFATFPDSAKVSIQSGARITLGSGLEDAIGTLVINGVTQPNGIYGSSESSAPVANQNDAYFAGTGTFRVGPVTVTPRDLVWEGLPGVSWETSETETNFRLGATPVGFRAYDNVTFGDKVDPNQRVAVISGAVQPSSITFTNSVGNDYLIEGSNGSIGGTTGIVKNGAGAVTLGGAGNTYTGPVTVNAGSIKMGSNSAFGVTSGITIAAGAQVDINGTGPGIGYTYTIAGNGQNSAAIVNSGGARFADSGIKNLILTADASIGNVGSRFDIGHEGTLTGNGHTLTKVGPNAMAFRGDGSGSPIHIVAEGGTIWAEASSSAFGGATGMLTIKNSGRAGTYATLSIATPVNIQTGGTLINQGAGTGTWTGAFTLAGDVTVDCGEAIEILGAVSGTANLSKSGGSSLTITNPVHVGNTTVTNGQLILGTAGLSDSGTVTLAGVDSKLRLAHGTTDTVAKLVLDGTSMADGVYVSTTNTQGIAGAITTPHIIGDTGAIRVTSVVAPAGYSTWANANIIKPENAALKGKLDDPDHDGFSNLQEYLFGTLPETSNGSLITMSQTGSDLVIRWNERPGATYTLQESTTMAENPWPTSGVVPVAAGDQGGVPAGYTRRQATVPVESGRKFVRVRGLEN